MPNKQCCDVSDGKVFTCVRSVFWGGRVWLVMMVSIPSAFGFEGSGLLTSYGTMGSAATIAESFEDTTEFTRSKNRVHMPEVKDDVIAFVASEGEIRGPYLEMALSDIRQAEPHLSEEQIVQRLLSII